MEISTPGKFIISFAQLLVLVHTASDSLALERYSQHYDSFL